MKDSDREALIAGSAPCVFLNARLIDGVSDELQHVPQKWEPVLRKRTCSSKEIERDDDSTKVIPL